jgi:hypothetical protein
VEKIFPPPGAFFYNRVETMEDQTMGIAMAAGLQRGRAIVRSTSTLVVEPTRFIDEAFFV